MRKTNIIRTAVVAFGGALAFAGFAGATDFQANPVPALGQNAKDQM